jgi:hypothetical protein
MTEQGQVGRRLDLESPILKLIGPLVTALIVSLLSHLPPGWVLAWGVWGFIFGVVLWMLLPSTESKWKKGRRVAGGGALVVVLVITVLFALGSSAAMKREQVVPVCRQTGVVNDSLEAFFGALREARAPLSFTGPAWDAVVKESIELNRLADQTGMDEFSKPASQVRSSVEAARVETFPTKSGTPNFQVAGTTLDTLVKACRARGIHVPNSQVSRAPPMNDRDLCSLVRAVVWDVTQREADKQTLSEGDRWNVNLDISRLLVYGFQASDARPSDPVPSPVATLGVALGPGSKIADAADIAKRAIEALVSPCQQQGIDISNSPTAQDLEQFTGYGQSPPP